MKMEKIGEWLFLLGVVIAIIAGIAMPNDGTIVGILVVLGIIVGLLNITEKESVNFMLASVALLVAGNATFSALPAIGIVINHILAYIGAFVAPAAVIVALKMIYELASKK
ncbi:MAG: hypothetical protein QXJ28_01530 [Candidatus Pacearchaeota archaeon]